MTQNLLHAASSLAGSLEDLAPALGNHLWQSTAFACVAGLLTLALRRNHARIRFGLWLAASLKFLVPFALLTAIGSHLAHPRVVSAPAPALVYTVQDLTAPFDLPTPIPPAVQQAPTLPTRDAIALAAALTWIIGFVAVLTSWTVRWLRIARMLRRAQRLDEDGTSAAKAATGLGRLSGTGKPVPLGKATFVPGAPFMARSDMGGDESVLPHPCPADTNGAPERVIAFLRRLEAQAGIRLMQARLTASTLEPGVFGIFHPVLAWPAGLSDQLSDAQLEAILAHEVAHVRHRDNLYAVAHMLVEAAFWFHPLVWLIGVRMLAERERACDEAVTQFCAHPDAYAEGILRVCKFCVESPLACVSGITGADLKRRITQIMTGRALLRLSRAKKAALVSAAVLALAVPITFGLNNPARIFAASDLLGWEKSAGGHQEFDAASVRSSRPGEQGYSNFSLDSGNSYVLANASEKFSPAGGYFSAKSLPLLRYIVFAYKLSGTQELALRFHFFRDLDTHTPDWVLHDGFDIEARAADHPTKDQMRLMMQSLLAERFKLAVHTETRQAPVFALVVSKPGSLGPHLRVHNATDSCDSPLPAALPIPCGVIAHLPASQPGAHRFGGRAIPLDLLATALPTQTGMAAISRPVIDRTGLSGTYDFDLEWTPEDTRDSPENSETGGTFRDALRAQLGLKLQAQTGPIELLVIDHVDHPTPQDETAPAAVGASSSQTVQPADSVPPIAFETVSVRRNPAEMSPATAQWEFRADGDGLVFRDILLSSIIGSVYGFGQNFQSGMPAWANSECYDIRAKVAEGDLPVYHQLTKEQRNRMVQVLLEDRFKLRTHVEKRKGPVYLLEVANGGPKLQTAPAGEAYTSGPKDSNGNYVHSSIFVSGPGEETAHSATMTGFAGSLQPLAGRKIIDQTGLTGKYDFTFKWKPNPADSDGPSIFTALQEQLGLKLVPAKAQAETLVIDHMDRPTEN